jgi:hypothetical protein
MCPGGLATADAPNPFRREFQLDRLRDRFSVAGAKDDRRDAYVQADGLRTDRSLFRRLQVADPRLIELRAWSRLAEVSPDGIRRTGRQGGGGAGVGRGLVGSGGLNR